MKTILATIMFLAGGILSAQTATAPVTGSISGILADDSSAKVSGADVSAYLQTTKAGQTPLTANALSGSEGSFSFNKLPAGTYLLCVEKRSANLLNPCLWGPNTTTVTIPAAGGNINAGTLTAERGVLLLVRVNDPQGLIAAAATKDDILIGTAHGSSPFMIATPQSADSTGKTVALLVRQATASNISVYSKNFKLANRTGTAFATPGVQIPVTPSATTATPGGSGTTPDLTISIVGVAAASNQPTGH